MKSPSDAAPGATGKMRRTAGDKPSGRPDMPGKGSSKLIDVGPTPTHRGAGEVRIIGGQWKRTPLAVASNQPGLRPTPARVRETLFNWLGQDLGGWRCIDAFAGTGALSFEAASRGAANVLICEQSSGLAAQLQKIAQRLKATTVRVHRGDGVAALRNASASPVDLVFIDPPFGGDLLVPALRAAVSAVVSGGCIYLEAPTAWVNTQLQELLLAAGDTSLVGTVERYLRAGTVHAHLLRITHASAHPAP